MKKTGLQIIMAAAAILAVLPAGGCVSAPDRRPDDAVLLTGAYAAGDIEFPAGLVDWRARPWWEYYDRPELDALIGTALADSPTLARMRARLEQAAAAGRQDFADLLPDAAISGERTTSNGDNERPSSFSLRGAASYELDLWGGNRATWQAGKLQARAAAEDLRTAAITLTASIVENWLTLMALREEEALLRRQVETNQTILDLQQQRYEGGVAQALDVLQQREVLARTKAQLPDVLARKEVVLNQLSVLAGRNPSLPLELTGNGLPEPLPVPETGIPAELLAARPDIQAAWLRLLSADWTSEAARVNRLPVFDISAAYSTGSTKFANLFETWLLDLALGLAAPVFAGGELAARQDQAEALADERFHAYREAVLQAIGEVENTLVRNRFQIDRIEAVEHQLAISRNALEQAQIAYSGGTTGYISVLNGLTNVQSLEQQLLNERLELALERVELYRTLAPTTRAETNDRNLE